MIAKSTERLTHEAVESRNAVDEWRVEAVNHDGDGEVYVAIFSGPDARKRAEEYAEWKNSGGNLD